MRAEDVLRHFPAGIRGCPAQCVPFVTGIVIARERRRAPVTCDSEIGKIAGDVVGIPGHAAHLLEPTFSF
ncbi:hypothetical protein GCM10009765_76090 [Fodinicola feengrottensis]|uniref:Uncharacterized protein n=1 Tax=Fodinicola feengrottensis TaxID=435914 RepID=A0ABN2J1J3_9ACTN